MKKTDVQVAIANYFSEHFNDLSIFGDPRLDTISNALATIQDKEYQGAGEYHVVLDVYGNIIDGSNGIKENEHFTTSCVVMVKTDEDGSPIIEINDNIILTILS